MKRKKKKRNEKNEIHRHDRCKLFARVASFSVNAIRINLIGSVLRLYSFFNYLVAVTVMD